MSYEEGHIFIAGSDGFNSQQAARRQWHDVLESIYCYSTDLLLHQSVVWDSLPLRSACCLNDFPGRLAAALQNRFDSPVDPLGLPNNDLRSTALLSWCPERDKPFYALIFSYPECSRLFIYLYVY